MLPTLPQSVLAAWGEDVAREFVAWIETSMTAVLPTPIQWEALTESQSGLEEAVRANTGRLDAVETRLDAVETRLDAVETRLGVVETRLGVVETRLGAVEVQLVKLNEAVVAARDRSELRMDRLSYQIISQTRWTVGTLVVLTSMLSALIAITR
ncbi:MAG: hypothetical protein ACE5EL_01660 [Anaerolineae bacterium]